MKNIYSIYYERECDYGCEINKYYCPYVFTNKKTAGEFLISLSLVDDQKYFIDTFHLNVKKKLWD